MRRVLPGRFAMAAMAAMTTMATMAGCIGSPKPVITGDPHEVGVAWVDVMFQLQSHDVAMGVDPENGRTIGAVLVRKRDLKEYSGTVYDHRFVVFSNLPPGTYSVVAIMGARDYTRAEVLETYDCGGEKGPCPMAMEVDVVLEPGERHVLTADIVPGKIHYLGTVMYDVIRQPPYNDIRRSLDGESWVDYLRHDSDRGRPRVSNEPEQEYRALFTLTEKLGNGPWESQFRGRRKQLWKELQGDRAGISL